MHEVSRLLQAAAALSQLLRDAGVPHAFHGNVLTAVLSGSSLADVRHSSVSAVSAMDGLTLNRKYHASSKVVQHIPSVEYAKLALVTRTSQ